MGIQLLKAACRGLPLVQQQPEKGKCDQLDMRPDFGLCSAVWRMSVAAEKLSSTICRQKLASGATGRQRGLHSLGSCASSSSTLDELAASGPGSGRLCTFQQLGSRPCKQKPALCCFAHQFCNAGSPPAPCPCGNPPLCSCCRNERPTGR